MVPPTSRGVYFTLQPTGTILSATFENGTITSQETFPDVRCPQKWVETLREMEAAVGGPSDLDFELDMFSNQLSNQEREILSPDATATLTENYMSNFGTPSSETWTMTGFQEQQNHHQQDNTQWLSTMRSPPSMTTEGANQAIHSYTSTPARELESCRSRAPSTQPSNMQKRPDWSSKRMTKVQNLLIAIRGHSIPTMDEHNRQVDGIYSGSYIPVALPEMSNMQFAGVLSRLGNSSNTLGFIYGMLSWEIFKREEERLIRDECLSMVLAAKQVNQQMSILLKHNGKAKDWASDGRKAAKIVFGTLDGCSIAVKSFALFLLGNVCSLDSMLKIAHFPIIRETFQMNFAQIVSEKTPQWEALATKNYQVFDYEEFLRHRGPPASIYANSLNLGFECPTPISIPRDGSICHGSDFSSSSVFDA